MEQQDKFIFPPYKKQEVSYAANPQWKEDVRTRKLCIANGGGVVHGIHYDSAG